MALRIRFGHKPGSSLAYSVERLSDGLLYDFSNSTFVSTPVTLTAALPEGTTSFVGRYAVNLTTPLGQFTNGNYLITVHDAANSNRVVAQLGAVMYGGDDAPTFPAGAGADPWSVALPGAYASGTAGKIVGDNVNATISSRSTYAGGAVASVTAAVTVGTNNDKSGYALSSAGVAAVWAALTSALTTAGSVGKKLADWALGTDNRALVSANAHGTGATVTAGVVSDKTGYSLSASQSFSTTGAVGSVTNLNTTAIAGAIWNDDLSAYGSGTAGRRLSDVAARPDPWAVATSTYTTPGTFGHAVRTSLDAAISSRSTYAGGAVASVTAPVTVGTVTDKSGYALSAVGLDAVQVEVGVNARQALSPILAAAAGAAGVDLSGNRTFAAGNNTSEVPTIRIVATPNRAAVTLHLPS